MSDDTAFTAWMADINQLCVERIGVTAEDLPDQTWRDWHDDDLTAAEALDAALANEGI
jgi:hypothetical protein